MADYNGKCLQLQQCQSEFTESNSVNMDVYKSIFTVFFYSLGGVVGNIYTNIHGITF